MRYLVGLVAAGLLVWAITFAAVLAVQTLWRSDQPVPDRADAIVCLGAGMSYRGWTLPGAASERRAHACADLHAAGAAPVVVFSGYGHETYSAAEAMADVARARGVPEQAIRIEPLARSTIQNAAFSLALFESAPDRVILVSDAFHLPRSWATFRLLGVHEVVLYAAPNVTTTGQRERTELGWILRESLAIWSNAGRLMAYSAAGLAGIDHETRIGWFN